MVLLYLLPEDLHKLRLLLLLVAHHFGLRGDDELLGREVLGGDLRVGIKVVVDEFEDEILVFVEGLDVAVEFEEMGGNFILQIIKLHYLFHLLLNLLEFALCLH